MKKLVVSLLAAGLVLPSAAALANNLEEGAVNTNEELTALLHGPTPAEKAAAEKAAAEKAAKEAAAKEAAADKVFVETAVAEVEASKEKGVKLEDGTRLVSPDGEVVLDKARTEVAKEEVSKKEEAKKDAAVKKAVAKKGSAAKAGKKALPKTSAAK